MQVFFAGNFGSKKIAVPNILVFIMSVSEWGAKRFLGLATESDYRRDVCRDRRDQHTKISKYLLPKKVDYLRVN